MGFRGSITLALNIFEFAETTQTVEIGTSESEPVNTEMLTTSEEYYQYTITEELGTTGVPGITEITPTPITGSYFCTEIILLFNKIKELLCILIYKITGYHKWSLNIEIIGHNNMSVIVFLLNFIE